MLLAAACSYASVKGAAFTKAYLHQTHYNSYYLYYL